MSDQTETTRGASKATGSSLGTQFAILMHIAQMQEACEVSSIALATGLSQSTVRRVIGQLRAAGLVSSAVGGGYILGEASVRLGQALRSPSKLEQLAQPVLQQLSRETGETSVVNRYLPDDGVALVVGLAETSRILSYRIELGERKYLHTGASGKVIMAFLTDRDVDDVIERRGLPPLTERTVIDRQHLKHDLRVIREQGYGISRGERLPGAIALAAPIFGPDRRVVGSLVVTVPEHRFDESRKIQVIESVVGAAASLSDQLCQSQEGTLP